MALAALKISIPGIVDETKGIIPGCRMAEVGKLAVFAGEDGEAKEFIVTPKMIDALAELGQQKGRLDAFWTHDRLNPENSGNDALHSSVGMWKNFRKDETGNLIADAHLAPTEYRERIMWHALNDPEGIMTSLVFSYTGGREDAYPTNLQSGDFVKRGAATTALLSAYPNKPTETPMTAADKEEINGLITKAVTAALAGFKPEPANLAELSEDEIAAMTAAEKEAGVTADDDKPEDAKLSRQMKSIVRIRRATLRKIEGFKTETAVLAQAEIAKNIGNGTFKLSGTPPAGTVTFMDRAKAKLADKSAKDMGAAIRLAALEDSKGYDEYRNGKRAA